MKAIGRGLWFNDKLSTLVLRGNKIEHHGLHDFIDACTENKNLSLKILDLSSNLINDEGGF
jgi:hypothetical protein